VLFNCKTAVASRLCESLRERGYIRKTNWQPHFNLKATSSKEDTKKVTQTFYKSKMISDDKSDPHSGSESSASEELSQHSNSIATSATSQIVAAFTNSNPARRSLATSSTDSTSVVSLASTESFGLNESRGHHHIAHYTPPTSGFFPNGGHLAPASLHMMTSPGGYGGHHLPTSSPEQNGATEANRKRAVRLQKNREAARECRRKKKEYIKCLENRVAVLENQNKALIEELRSLKELYSGKGFGSHEAPKIEIL